MNVKALLVVSLSLGLLAAYSLARAEGRGGGHGGGEAPHGQGRALPPRMAPPAWQAHQPGVHPHGPIVRPHQVRVLAPRAVGYGGHEWRHWEHPEFLRPAYYWEWGTLHNVTCIAEDSYGDQYPVSEATFAGFGLVNMTAVEDDALDRCAAESGGDTSCYLATCSPY